MQSIGGRTSIAVLITLAADHGPALSQSGEGSETDVVAEATGGATKRAVPDSQAVSSASVV